MQESGKRTKRVIESGRKNEKDNEKSSKEKKKLKK